MITKIKLENYRGYKEAEFSLKPLTLLIGPVAGGKSNFFKALVLLQNTLYRQLNELFPPGPNEFRWVRNRMAKETDPIGFEVEIDDIEDFPGDKARYILQIAEAPQGLYVLREELIRISPDRPEMWVFRRDIQGGKVERLGDFPPTDNTILNATMKSISNNLVDPRDPQKNLTKRTLSRYLNNARSIHLDEKKDENFLFIISAAESLSLIKYYHLEASGLKEPGEGQKIPSFSPQGKRLPDFIAWLKSEKEDTFIQITKDLDEIIYNFKDIIITQVAPEQQSIGIAFKGHKGFIPAQDISDGTMFALGILCIVYNPFQPKLLCIEEPETGLHPRLMRWLFDRLAGLSYTKEGEKRVQVIISSHSPMLLDMFEDNLEAVLVIEQRNGESKVFPLEEILRVLKSNEDSPPLSYEWAAGLFEGLL